MQATEAPRAHHDTPSSSHEAPNCALSPGEAVVAMCVDAETVPPGKRFVRWKRADGEASAAWAAALRGVEVQTGDQVLLTRPANADDAVIVGVLNAAATPAAELEAGPAPGSGAAPTEPPRSSRGGELDPPAGEVGRDALPPAELREGLNVERFAEVMAHLRHFSARPASDVLATFDLTPERWAAAQEAWLQAFAQDNAPGEPLSARFEAAFAGALEQLCGQAAAPTGTLPVGLAPNGASSTPLSGPAHPGYARRARHPDAPSPWAADVKGTFAGLGPRPEPPLPFVGSDAPSPLATPTSTASGSSVARPRAGLAATQDAPAAAGAFSCLPFLAPASAPPPEPPLSLERCVSLCVELEECGIEHEAETLARYQISAERAQQAKAYWRQRIDADSATRAAWERGEAAYRAWFREATRKAHAG